MGKYLSPSKFKNYLLEHIGPDELDIHQIYDMYLEMMNLREFAKFKKIKIEQMVKNMNALCSGSDAVLDKSCIGNKRKYSKREEPLPTVKGYLDRLAFSDKIKMSPLYDKAQEIYRRGKERLIWCK